MNKIFLIGRLTKNPEIRYSQSGMPIAIYTLAVDRPNRNFDDPTADFIRCVCLYQRTAEFAEQYLYKGIKIAITGHIQTGSYTNQEGQRVYTTDVIVETQEFAESKRSSVPDNSSSQFSGGHVNVPNEMDEELPFN